MRRSVFVLLLAALVFFAPRLASARTHDPFGPITVRTQNPIYLQMLGLKPKKAEVLPEGTLEGRIDSAYSNIFEQGRSATSALDLDMELWRLGINVGYGVAEDFEIGVEIPMLHFSGGFLDGFIQDFHTFFGLPNGGRSRVPNNAFTDRLVSGGQTIFNYPPATWGLGDITFTVKQQVAGQDSDWPALAWFAELKFPTGRPSRGFGSGVPNFGFGTALDASYKRVHGHFNAGYYVTARDDALAPFVHDEMFAFMVAGEVTLLPTWSLIVQLQGGTPLLKGTGIDAWDGVPLDLIVGFRGEEEDLFKGGGDLIWQFGFSEDVTSRGPSVDFTVFLSIGVRFDLFGRTRPAGDWLALH